MADRVVVNGVSIREMAGREGTDATGSGSAELIYLCKDNVDPLVCRDALLTVAPALYDGLQLASISRTRIADEAWEFTLAYANVPAPGGYEVTIDTTGGTVRVTEAFAASVFQGAGMTPLTHGTAINVSDGKVEGVDRVIGALKLNIVAKIAKKWVTDPITYAKTIANLTGFTNNAPYLGFATGELLFLGASGQIISSSDPTLTFTFEASPNVTGGQIGPITGITKAGHDYLWVDYQREKDANSKRDILVPRAVYVDRLYNAADFSPLQIGVP
jgi:hypothetical protein